jgi:hypothetical protein
MRRRRGAGEDGGAAGFPSPGHACGCGFARGSVERHSAVPLRGGWALGTGRSYVSEEDPRRVGAADGRPPPPLLPANLGFHICGFCAGPYIDDGKRTDSIHYKQHHDLRTRRGVLGVGG